MVNIEARTSTGLILRGRLDLVRPREIRMGYVFMTSRGTVSEEQNTEP